MKITIHNAVWAFMLSGMVFYAGWISAIVYFKVPDQWRNTHKLVQVETSVVPKLKTDLKQASCDKQRLASVAGQAIVAANNETVPVPSIEDVSGCDKVSPVKAPTVKSVVAGGTEPR